VALRDRMRRIDVDTITFDFGSWEVAPDQVARLQLVAQAIQEVVSRNPNEVFLVEGHTDAVGQDVDNLSLSDRRAETVASILTESFQIPPENLTSQGYGAHFLKIQTPEANRQNRRVTIRRITPLLTGSNG
jgi:outer membrane protein OmpA-like peptidoglycan-associated protein